MDVPVVTPATAAGVATVPALPPRTPFAALALAPAACVASDASCRSPGVAIGITVVVLLGIALILMLLLPRRTEEVVVVRDDALRTAVKAAGTTPEGADEIDEADALKWLGGGHRPGHAAVLMVYAPWCGACKATKPGYDAAAKEAAVATASKSKPIHFLMVDGMKARGLMSKHGVTAFPTIFGIRADGRVVKFPAGTARGKEQLLAFAAKLAANEA